MNTAIAVRYAFFAIFAPMFRFDIAFACAQVAVLAVIAIALMIWPGTPAVYATAWFAGVWLVVSALYSRCHWRSRAGWWVLLVATALLGVGFAINVNYFTVVSGGTLDNPVLQNVDSQRAWSAAMYELGLPGGEYLNTMRGYGTFVSWQMSLFGINIAVPLMFNVLFVLLTIILAGAITERVCEDRRSPTVAMVMAASVCYFLASGLILLKDATVCLSMALAVYSLLRLRDFSLGQLCVPIWAMLALAIAGLYLVRGNYIPYVCIMAVFILPWRRNCSMFVTTAVFLVAAVVVWRLSFWVGGFASPAAEVVACEPNAVMFNVEPQHRAYADMLGDYPRLDWWQKLMRLPMSVIVQYFIPFPWNFARDTVFGPSQAYAHIAYPWYVVGGFIIYFALFRLWRNRGAVLSGLLVAGLILCVCTAYITGGTVSRYCLPMLPMLVPAAAYTLVNCRKEKTFRVFFICYVAMMVPILVIAHHLQMSAL